MSKRRQFLALLGAAMASSVLVTGCLGNPPEPGGGSAGGSAPPTAVAPANLETKTISLGFIPIRKQGKLPWKTKSAAYALEYGEAVVEIHEDAIKHGQKVALIDDVLATGGTAAAAVKLLSSFGSAPVVAAFLMELTFLNGRENLPGTRIESLISY